MGGYFTNIGEADRNYIAAIDTTSGEATDFNPNADDYVNALVLSGTTFYVGGAFTNIGGADRYRIAAIDTTTGEATSWDPNANDEGLAFVQSGTTLYVGGGFTSIGGADRNEIAAINTATGEATAFDPNASECEDSVHALVLSGTTLYVGGCFTNIGGASRNALAAIDTTTGNATSWDASVEDYYVYALAFSGTSLYVGGSFSSVGNLGHPYFAQFDEQSSPTSTSTSTPGTSSPGASVCGDAMPGSAPDLFQITATKTSATLYFAPASGSVNKYFIAYGRSKDSIEYGVEFPYGYSSGAIPYTVNLLRANTNYYFKVRAGNGCMPGFWSQTLRAKTTSSLKSRKSFYPKDLVERVSVYRPLQSRFAVLGSTTSISTNLEPTATSSPNTDATDTIILDTSHQSDRSNVLDFIKRIIGKVGDFFR